jgi:predicted ATPase/DNA-binding CsgD family transcriptional regulator
MQSFPLQHTPFLGRRAALEQVTERLGSPDCRLLSLVGPGGVGKTRLAIEAAQQLAGGFRDGAYFVSLQPLSHVSLLVPTIAEVIQLSFFGGDQPKAHLLHALGGRRCLLVLDNFEHLLDGATLISEILAEAPHVKVLVTSRERLNLQEEWVFNVKGMDSPSSVYSESIEDYEAVQLFLHHVRRVQPDFSLAEEQEGVIRICTLAEGMPLALEMAASWAKALSCQQIADEMQHSLNILTAQTRNTPERHRSMRAVFNHSWHLLSAEEEAVFASLSAFRGGFELDAAEKVANASLATLVSLVDKSFLRKRSATRCDIHELLRQYGQEQLEASGMAGVVHTAHSRYYLQFVAERGIEIKTPDQFEALKRIDQDFDNIRTAWNWAVRQRDTVALDRAIQGLYHYGFLRSHYHETVPLFVDALETLSADEQTPPALIGRLLAHRWGYLHWWQQRDYQTAIADIDRALEIAKSSGQPCDIAFSHLMRGYAAMSSGQYDEALHFFEASRFSYHEMDEPYYESWALHRVAFSYLNLGDRERYVELTEKSLELARAAYNQVAVVNCLYNLGADYLLSGFYRKGADYSRQALEIATQLGQCDQIAHSNNLLALACLSEGDMEAARAYVERGLALIDELNMGTFRPYPLTILIVLACVREDYAEASRLERAGRPYNTNLMGYELIDLARAILAWAMDDAETCRQYVYHALGLTYVMFSPVIVRWLLPCAAWLLSETQPERATELLGAAFAEPDTTMAWIEGWRPTQELFASVKLRLGEPRYRLAWEQGKNLVLENLIPDLRNELDTDVGAPPPLVEPLTQREIEVLRLMSSGLSNPEIAQQFVISAGTVKTHTLNIYRKLDVRNRTEAINRARALHLLN